MEMSCIKSWETQCFLIVLGLDIFGFIKFYRRKEAREIFFFPLDCKQRKPKDPGK